MGNPTLKLKQNSLRKTVALPSLSNAGVNRLFDMAGSLYDFLSYFKLY